MNAVLRGAKGGDAAASTPTEAPDSLHSVAYARILDLVSEGEIQGFAHPANPLQDIFLDSTPLANADGTLNFQNVQVDSRSGTQTQTVLTGFPDVENETAVNLELKSTVDWTQAINDLALNAVRVMLSVPALSQSNTSTGDITGYSIQYEIELSTDGGSYQTMLTSAFTGKTTSKYQRSHRIDLPAATSGWTLRVHRITANQNLATVADTMMVESYTEIVDAKFSYPNSAVIGLIIDSQQFSSIPQRAYNLLGRIVSVPSNYNPTTRVYTGAWDGSFKPAWTNNPAWIFYDLATNARYGLGQYITAAQVNKWNLYKIAQYCDELVPDGMGGQEPRFTCTLYLQQQADAYKVLQDLATVFRGISFWGAGQINAVADMPSDPVYTYTAANVLGGKFTYQGSGKKTRFTVALVSWNDPTDLGRAKVEYVPDREGIARYGINITQVTATGATSRGQAQRVGLWTLLTSRIETETVSFGVGLDGTIAAPGQVIRIADPARAGKRQAGRIHSATATAITVDAAPTVAVGDSLTCTLPTGVTETHTVTGVAGSVISVAAPGFSAVPQTEAVWVTESASLTAATFRVVSVVEDQTAPALGFTLTALAHNASKFAAIDFGAPIVIPPITAIPPSVQPAPATVTLEAFPTFGQVLTQTTLTIQWDATPDAVYYHVEWRKDSGDWQVMPIQRGLSVDVHVWPGSYLARVAAVNASGIGSVATASNTYVVVDQTQASQRVEALSVQLDANLPPIQNPNFATGDLTGWIADAPAEWSIGSAASPFDMILSYVQHQYVNDGTTALRNVSVEPVQAGDVITITTQIFGSGTPNGQAWARIEWIDNTGTTIGTADGDKITGNGLATSRANQVAPTGAVVARAALAVDSHTIGIYAFTGVAINGMARSLDEVPNGNVQIAGTQISDSETVDNAAFEMPIAPGGGIYGWRPATSGTSGPPALTLNTTTPYAGTQSLHVVNTGANTGVSSTRTYKCRPGDVYLVAMRSAGGIVGANNVRVGLTFFGGGAYINRTTAALGAGSAYQLLAGQVQVPAGADSFQISAWCAAAGTTTWDMDDVVLARMRTQDMLSPTTWAGVRSVLSASPLAFSISGTTVNFTTTAFTNYGGGLNVAYNAASASATQAAGTTVTYYAYFIDPTSSGGSQTLHITTSVQVLAQSPFVVNIGSATVTVAAGGGGSSGTGSGGGGFCVCGDMWVDSAVQAKDAPLGYLFDCCNFPESGTLVFKRPLLAYEMHVDECVQITTEGGGVWRGGVTTPFDTVDGRVLRAPQMLDEIVLTDHGLERVVEVRPIGKQVVYFNHFGGISYAVGQDPHYRIFSHNPGTQKP